MSTVLLETDMQQLGNKTEMNNKFAEQTFNEACKTKNEQKSLGENQSWTFAALTMWCALIAILSLEI